MTIDEALLYDAEWWITPLSEMEAISLPQKEVDMLISYGYDYSDNYETVSFFLLLVREAIKC